MMDTDIFVAFRVQLSLDSHKITVFLPGNTNFLRTGTAARHKRNVIVTSQNVPMESTDNQCVVLVAMVAQTHPASSNHLQIERVIQFAFLMVQSRC